MSEGHRGDDVEATIAVQIVEHHLIGERIRSELSRGGAWLRAPVPKKIRSSLAWELAMTRSVRPSPSRSPAAIDRGLDRRTGAHSAAHLESSRGAKRLLEQAGRPEEETFVGSETRKKSQLPEEPAQLRIGQAALCELAPRRIEDATVADDTCFLK